MVANARCFRRRDATARGREDRRSRWSLVYADAPWSGLLAQSGLVGTHIDELYPCKKRDHKQRRNHWGIICSRTIAEFSLYCAAPRRILTERIGMERRAASHTEEEEMNQRRRLLNAAKKGDKKAVSKLFELYQVRIYSGEMVNKLNRAAGLQKLKGAQQKRAKGGPISTKAVPHKPAGKTKPRPKFKPKSKPSKAHKPKKSNKPKKPKRR